jgi:SAM-dependent methyltransferase
MTADFYDDLAPFYHLIYADLRELRHAGDASLAAVLACDNSIPHLLDDGQIQQAFRSCLRCLRPGGIAIFSVRDYDCIERRNPDLRPHAVRVVTERTQDP